MKKLPMSLRETMRDRIKQVLLNRILDGTYKPGDRLVEMQIAREMDTSQAPVREALRELEVMRLVESEAYRSTRVREVSQHELQEFYQVRAELEAFAARLAAPLFYEDPEPLQTALASLLAAVQAKDFEQITRHDAAFHRLIVETSGNSVLLHVWNSLAIEAWTRINVILLKQKRVNLQSLFKEHQEIADALVQGDGTTSGELLRKHIETALTLEAK